MALQPEVPNLMTELMVVLPCGRGFAESMEWDAQAARNILQHQAEVGKFRNMHSGGLEIG
jgi:hypothetical protein